MKKGINAAGQTVPLDSLVGCQCTLAQRLCGDGCQFCNPELGAELKWNAEADEWNQWNNLGQDEKDELIEKFKASNTVYTNGCIDKQQENKGGQE